MYVYRTTKTKYIERMYLYLRNKVTMPYLLHRVVHKAEVLRPSHHRSRDKVGLDQLEEGTVEVLDPVTAVARQHVQQQPLAERRSDNWGSDCIGGDT